MGGPGSSTCTMLCVRSLQCRLPHSRRHKSPIRDPGGGLAHARCRGDVLRDARNGGGQSCPYSRRTWRRLYCGRHCPKIEFCLCAIQIPGAVRGQRPAPMVCCCDPYLHHHAAPSRLVRSRGAAATADFPRCVIGTPFDDEEALKLRSVAP